MKHNKIYVFILCLLLSPLIMSVTCYANPDTGPFITIIVDDAPSDLKITFGERGEGYEYKRGRETQIYYHSGELPREKGYKISVTTNGKTTEYTIDTPLEYRNIYTLNLKDNTLTNGKTPLRYIRLVIIYVLLTLLLEGFIFYIVGFREKRSWIAFIIINLITQCMLHIWTDSPNWFDRYMDYFGIDELILGLVFGEIFVFLFEVIAFAKIVKEKSLIDRIVYALAANSFSLIIGLFMVPFIHV